jgi:hypothetical protein
MIYDYKCAFGHKFSVIKSIKDYEGGDVPCQFCEGIAFRDYCAPHTAVRRDFEPAFYPTLGQAFENKRKLQYHLDKNNLVEVGNDFKTGEVMQTHFEKQREYEREKAWDKL